MVMVLRQDFRVSFFVDFNVCSVCVIDGVSNVGSVEVVVCLDLNREDGMIFQVLIDGEVNLVFFCWNLNVRLFGSLNLVVGFDIRVEEDFGSVYSIGVQDDMISIVEFDGFFFVIGFDFYGGYMVFVVDEMGGFCVGMESEVGFFLSFGEVSVKRIGVF